MLKFRIKTGIGLPYWLMKIKIDIYFYGCPACILDDQPEKNTPVG